MRAFMKRIAALVAIFLLALSPAAAILQVNQLAGFGIVGAGAVTIVQTAAPAASSADAASYTYTAASIGAASDDRDVLVAVMASQNTTARTLNSVTIGGVTAALDVNVNTTASRNAACAIARLRVTSGTTADVVVTYSGAMLRNSVVVYAMTGATGSPFHVNSVQQLGAPTSTTLNIPDGGSALGCFTANATSPGDFTWTGLTEDVDRTVENANNKHGTAFSSVMTGETGRSISVSIASGSTFETALAVASYTP